jgi:hydrogenase maturation protease
MTGHVNDAAAGSILVFSYGNPSRGDDALGPAMHAELEQHLQRLEDTSVELLTDFQLQIEHAVDLQDRGAVIFVDAGISSTKPYTFARLEAQRDETITSHAMSPSAVLQVYEDLNHEQPPPCYMLTICGYTFGLGKPLSAQAQINLDESLMFLSGLFAKPVDTWDRFVQE